MVVSYLWILTVLIAISHGWSYSLQDRTGFVFQFESVLPYRGLSQHALSCRLKQVTRYFKRMTHGTSGKPSMSVQGAGSHRGGRFPRLEPLETYHHHLEQFDTGHRWIITVRKNRYHEAFKLQMKIVARATPIAPGLWETETAIPRVLLPSLAAVRAEILPLVRVPSRTVEEFSDSIRLLRLGADDWALHHERVEKIAEEVAAQRSSEVQGAVGGSLRGSALRSAVADSVGGRPNHKKPRIVYVILESQMGLMFGVATWSQAESKIEAAVELWNRRPMQFSSALDGVAAWIAVSYTKISAGEMLLDPCCGSGSILFAGLQFGARVLGLDASARMVWGTRSNLAHAGYPSLAGGGMRRWSRMDMCAEEEAAATCMVCVHDMRGRFDSAGLSRVASAHAVIANLPHGTNLALPHHGYIRDILVALAASFRSSMPTAAHDSQAWAGPRFVFVSGGKLHETGGGNNVWLGLGEAGFQVEASTPILGGALALTCATLTLKTSAAAAPAD